MRQPRGIGHCKDGWEKVFFYRLALWINAVELNLKLVENKILHFVFQITATAQL
jgi:hypothetical protein